MHKKFKTVIPQEPLFFAIQKLNSNPINLIPVIDPTESKIIGVVTQEKILEILESTETPQK